MGILFVSTDNFFLLFTKETSRVLWCRRYKFLGSLYKCTRVYTRQGIVALIRFLSISYHIMLYRICFQYMRNEMANDYALSMDSLEVCSL